VHSRHPETPLETRCCGHKGRCVGKWGVPGGSKKFRLESLRTPGKRRNRFLLCGSFLENEFHSEMGREKIRSTVTYFGWFLQRNPFRGVKCSWPSGQGKSTEKLFGRLPSQSVMSGFEHSWRLQVASKRAKTPPWVE